MSEPLFLTDEEVATLTGIAKGRLGRSREQLQIEWLRANGIAHKVNARGAPVVYRSQFISSQPASNQAERTPWASKALKAA